MGKAPARSPVVLQGAAQHEERQPDGSAEGQGHESCNSTGRAVRRGRRTGHRASLPGHRGPGIPQRGPGTPSPGAGHPSPPLPAARPRAEALPGAHSPSGSPRYLSRPPCPGSVGTARLPPSGPAPFPASRDRPFKRAGGERERVFPPRPRSRQGAGRREGTAPGRGLAHVTLTNRCVYFNI